jgi:A/G-specific adenine glycosylase
MVGLEPHTIKNGMNSRFRRLLLDWFDAHARDLPWRRTDDPYAIWVSEIMLQQTRVNAVLDHYARFMTRFPTVETLAAADEPEVLAIWSGLGYYRRARMLHKAAKVVASELGGKLPETAEALRQLPGIGEYTSAAIASIAFSEPVAAVDGNVERVILRLTGSETKAVRETAQALLDRSRPGDHNQAMMELGATICLPKNPICLDCPVHAICRVRGEHPTVKRPKMHSKETFFALFERKNRQKNTEILLEQRSKNASLMPGMWELPHFEAKTSHENRIILSLRHSITTTNYQVSILNFAPDEQSLLSRGKARKWIKAEDLPKLPLTGLARKVLKRLHILPGSIAEASKLLFYERSVAE